MPRSLLLLLAMLPLLLAVMLADREHEPRGVSRTSTSTSPAHARVTARAPSSDCVMLDDDDESADDDELESALLAPGSSDDVVVDEAMGDGRRASAKHAPNVTRGSSGATGHGVSRAAEHRSAADKPPQA